MTTDYGLDISTYAAGPDGPDLDPQMTTISGPAIVVQAIARRLQTPHGFFDDDPDYGLDVRGWLNGSFSSDYASTLRHLVEAECEKDDRVASAEASVTFAASRLTVLVKLTLETGQTFQLTLSVSSIASDVNILQTG